MSKKKKENKHQLPQAEEGSPKPASSKYFTNIFWLDQMHDGVRLINFNDAVVSSHALLAAVSTFADSFHLEYQGAWNVETAKKYYEDTCRYNLTPIFCIYWIDYLIDRVGEALYLCEYRRVFSDSVHQDTTRRDKEADRSGLEVQNKFLDFVKTYNKEFK